MWRFASAIRNCEPIIIEDIEDIREEAPEEYEMYKRLKVKSVLGVPYRFLHWSEFQQGLKDT